VDALILEHSPIVYGESVPTDRGDRRPDAEDIALASGEAVQKDSRRMRSIPKSTKQDGVDGIAFTQEGNLPGLSLAPDVGVKRDREKGEEENGDVTTHGTLLAAEENHLYLTMIRLIRIER
jgi:hypothetical protein